MNDKDLNTSPMVTNFAVGTNNSARMSEGEESISLEVVLQAIRRRIWVILLSVLVCTGAAVGYTHLQTPLYQASITVLIGQQGLVEDPGAQGDLQAIGVTLSQAVTTRPITQPVTRRLDLKESPEALSGGLSATTIPDTQFIEISYTDTNPRRAQLIVNTVGEEFVKKVDEISPNVSGITATLWEKASAPGYPVGPGPVRNGLIGAMLGLLLGVGLTALLEYLDDSWRSPEELEVVSGVPTLGSVPTFEVAKDGR